MISILVVEDDATLNKMICTKLRLEGFAPLPAANGADALRTTRDHHIDFVITDLMMPEMDGNALIEELRAWRPALPVLVMTAKSQTEDMAESFGLGADDYLVKPVDLSQLVLHVRALLQDRLRVRVGATVLDADKLTVAANGDEQVLPPKEFSLLFKLASPPAGYSRGPSCSKSYGGPKATATSVTSMPT
jgi:two-component system OmpR family response regulator